MMYDANISIVCNSSAFLIVVAASIYSLIVFGKAGCKLAHCIKYPTSSFEFRYSLVHVLSYGLIILPAIGCILCENEVVAEPIINNGDEQFENLSFCEHLFLPRPIWQYTLLLFAIFRVAYPFVLTKTDSYLRQKINFIIR